MSAFANVHSVAQLVTLLQSEGWEVTKKGEAKKGPVLDERNFRRQDKFDGDRAKYTQWLFDFQVKLGAIDKELVRCIKGLLSDKIPDPSPTALYGEGPLPTQGRVDVELEAKYGGALYNLVCDLTTGEAKKIVKAISDKHGTQDGFAALVAINNAFNQKTPGSLIQALMSAINPPKVRTPGDCKGLLWFGRRR